MTHKNNIQGVSKNTFSTTNSGSQFFKHRPSGPMLSMSQNVLMFVCVFVCLSIRHIFSLHFTVFLRPLPEVQCPNFLNIPIFFEKVRERSGPDLKAFAQKGFKITSAKMFFTIFFHLFIQIKRFFAPTFRGPMSKLFRYSESLGKGNGKKWSQIVKHFFFGEFCLASNIFLVSVLLSQLCYHFL